MDTTVAHLQLVQTVAAWLLKTTLCCITLAPHLLKKSNLKFQSLLL